MAPRTRKFAVSTELGVVDTSKRVVDRFGKRVSGVFRTIESGRRRVRGGILDLRQRTGLNRLASDLGGVRDAAGGIARNLFSAARAAGVLAIAGVGAGVALVRSFAIAGDSVDKASQRLGLGIEELQEWRFAAELSGIEARTFDLAVQRAGRRVAEAAVGTGEARGALLEMGIATRDAEGRVRSISSLLPEFARKLAATEDPLTRNRLAMKLFDSEGVQMVQLLGLGADEVERLRMEARALGGVMDEDMIRRAKETRDAWTRARFALLGVRNLIGSELAPVVTDLSNRLALWVRERGPQIREFATRFAEGLPDKLRELVELGRDVAREFGPFVDRGRQLVEKYGPARVLLVAFAAMLTAKLLPAVVLALKGVGLLTSALLLNPIGLWVTGISLLILGLVKLEKRFGFLGRAARGFGSVWDKMIAPIWDRVWWVLSGDFGRRPFRDGRDAPRPGPVRSFTGDDPILADPLPGELARGPAPSAEGAARFSAGELAALGAAVARGVAEAQAAGAVARVQIAGAPPGSSAESFGGVDVDLGFVG